MEFEAAIGLICFLTVSCAPVGAAERLCAKWEAMQAETEASTLDGWGSVYRSYKQFEHCDDGAIGEGYSDAVGRLLSENCTDLNVLVYLTLLDKVFGQFVIDHIDETVPAHVLDKIFDNAIYDCQAVGKYMCVDIKRKLEILDSYAAMDRAN